MKKLDYKQRERLYKGCTPILSIILALLIGAIVIILCGYNPLSAYKSMMKGAFGNIRYTLATFEKCVPLILTGLAASVAMKSGIFNIGAEGQLYMGALGYAFVALFCSFLPGPLQILLGCIVAMVFGALWNFLPAVMKFRLGANEVVTGIMMNYIAKLFISFMVSGPIKTQSVNIPESDRFRDAVRIFEIIPKNKITWCLPIAIILCVFVSWFLKRTRIGYDINAAGINARAAEAGGVRPDSVRMFAMLTSGAIAGLAGAFVVASSLGRLVVQVSPGYGFDGISIAVLGQYSCIGILLSSLLFGALRTGSLFMEMFQGIPSELIDVVQGLIIVIVASPVIFSFLKRGGRNER